MQDEPTPVELTKAVADFLRHDITPMISGHNAFKLRVAINMLDLVTRQLTLEQGSDAAEAARLTQLLGMQGSLGDLNRALADRIAKGERRPADAGLCRASVADHDGQARGRSAELRRVQAGIGHERRLTVIACDKREAFAQGGVATKQSTTCRDVGNGCFAPLAMTGRGPLRYFPTHFGGRFSENAFGPSM